MYSAIKRCFDVISATLLIIIISPIFLFLIILVRFNLGSPVFFTQERAGRGMKKINIIKFRTMTNDKDDRGNLLPDEKRQTKFGKKLRSSSLDELPELINIIKGDMSVIGPRPLPIGYNAYYKVDELARFNVRSGLITPDSVDKDPIVSWNKQFKYEADYANNLSFMNDFKIFINVFRILFSRNKSGYGEFIREKLDVERAELKK